MSEFDLIQESPEHWADANLGDLGFDAGTNIFCIATDTRRSVEDRMKDVRLAIAHSILLSGQPERLQLQLLAQTLVGLSGAVSILANATYQGGSNAAAA